MYGQLLKNLYLSKKYGFLYGREIVNGAKYIVQTLQSMDNVVKTLIFRKMLEVNSSTVVKNLSILL